MPCYYPLTIPHPKHGQPIIVNCGQCIGCRLERSRQWAARILHESKSHEDNCFITLTYNDDNIPASGSLVKSDVQLFIKRLRKSIAPKRISYFHCGEYGSKTDRPHYHLILFGHDFPDKKTYKITETGDRLFVSEILEKLWGKGFCPIGNVSFESAAYVARYCVEKLTGDAGKLAYESTGRISPYVTMSTRPAIGRAYYEKYTSDIYNHDEIIVRGTPCKPPRYYDKLLEKSDKVLHSVIKRNRIKSAESKADAVDTERLRVKEKVKLAQIGDLKKGRNKI